MEYKEKTKILINILKKHGWKVNLESNLSEEYYGMIYYRLKLIDINPNNSAKETFYTLCHEAGHLISYKLLGKIISKEYLGHKITEGIANKIGFIIWRLI